MTILWKSFVPDSGIRSDPFQPFNLLTLSLQSFPIPFIPMIPVKYLFQLLPPQYASPFCHFLP